jgi:hypothetical protein
MWGGLELQGICTGRWRPVARLIDGAVLVLAVAMKDVMAAAGMSRRGVGWRNAWRVARSGLQHTPELLKCCASAHRGWLGLTGRLAGFSFRAFIR